MKAGKVLRTVAEILIIVLFVLCLLFHELLVYGLAQGRGQLAIIYNSRNVSEVHADPAVADSVKIKLQLIEKIRNYVFDSIGIKRNENYTTFFDQGGRPLLWVITGAEKYKMRSYEWRFPVIGKVNYKGFFEKDRAIIEQAELHRKGYDNQLSTVSGWSTLGFFRDPVLSQMMGHNEGMLAELIIHELTHGTLYVKSDVTFNENLATFIGEMGALQFLHAHYGPGSRELEEYLQAKKDEKDFTLFSLYFANQLKQLYRSEKDTIRLESGKKKIIEDYIGFIKSSAIKSRKYHRAAEKALKGGNAFFMGFETYDSRLAEFHELFDRQHNRDLRSFLTFLKSKYGRN